MSTPAFFVGVAATTRATCPRIVAPLRAGSDADSGVTDVIVSKTGSPTRLVFVSTVCWSVALITAPAGTSATAEAQTEALNASAQSAAIHERVLMDVLP